MKELKRYLGEVAPTDETDEDWSRYRMLGYVNQIVLTRHTPSQIGIRNQRELITLASGIDLLLQGKLGELGDLMVQRLKALESSLGDQSWQTARHQELIPATTASLTGEIERRRAAKMELANSKLRGMLQKNKGPPNK